MSTILVLLLFMFSFIGTSIGLLNFFKRKRKQLWTALAELYLEGWQESNSFDRGTIFRIEGSNVFLFSPLKKIQVNARRVQLTSIDTDLIKLNLGVPDQRTNILGRGASFAAISILQAASGCLGMIVIVATLGVTASFVETLLMNSTLAVLAMSVLSGTGFGALIAIVERINHLRDTLIPAHATALLQPLVRTGDDKFDNTFQVRGREHEALAVLNSDTRQLLTTIQQRNSLQIHNQTISFYSGPRFIDGKATPSFEQSDKATQAMIDILAIEKRLQIHEDDIPAALSRNVLHDEDIPVRVRNFRILLTKYKKHEVTQQTLQKARTNDAPEVASLAELYLHSGQLTTAGQLSLDTEGSAGQLSMQEDKSGGVSFEESE
jgi:hypothetical protein